MLYNGSDVIRDLEWVIFDEVHYINDAEVSGENGSLRLKTLLCRVSLIEAVVPTYNCRRHRAASFKQ